MSVFNPFIFEETDLCYRALEVEVGKIYFDGRRVKAFMITPPRLKVSPVRSG